MSRQGRITTVAHLIAEMERIAPTCAAADWDNVGLLVGSEDWPLRRILLTIDLTAGVLDEAKRRRSDAVVSYHPPIFRAVKKMTLDPQTPEGLAAGALANRLAIYTPHTALDAAAGGTNDTLAGLCGLVDTAPFAPVSESATRSKLVVFVPDSHVERVAEALFGAGAGVIGDYAKCSYRTIGYGTFFGGASTDPTLGKRGRLERVEEVRLEVVLPSACLQAVVAAVRESHPYEEPAFDVYPLAAVPPSHTGQGRVGRFRKPVKLGELARMLKKKTGAANVSIIGRPLARVRRGFVCVGAAGRLPFEAEPQPCGPGDVVVTGEIRHHDALDYQRRGAAAIALGHWASERPVLAPLAVRLRKNLPGVSVTVSRADCDPFQAA